MQRPKLTDDELMQLRRLADDAENVPANSADWQQRHNVAFLASLLLKLVHEVRDPAAPR